MLRIRDAVAHAKVLADFSSAIVYQAVAAGARFKLLYENNPKFGVNLGLHPHAVEHRDDTVLSRLLLDRWDELFVLN